MIAGISDAWKTRLRGESGSASASNERFYIDFRRRDYLPITDSAIFTLITTSDNQPGSHYLSGSAVEYLLTLPDTFTFEIRFRPQFAYDVATNQVLLDWTDDTDSYFRCQYNATDDKFEIAWYDTGTERTMQSQQYDDGTTYEDINQWITLTASVDLTTGDTTGSQLWIDRVSQDDAWSGAIDSVATNKNVMQINAADNYDIVYLRFFDGYTTTNADVGNAFRDVKNEETYWDFNGNLIGKLRCNITRHVRNWSYVANAQNDRGSQTANRANLRLKNYDGQFSDDQYADFDPTNDIFNGTVAQKYLRKKCGVFVETWYENEYEPIFVGYLDDERFSRSVSFSEPNEVTIGAEDLVAQIAHKKKRNSLTYETINLSDSTDETNSALHKIVRIATAKEVFNYCGNSSFTVADITDSWEGSDCVVTRDDTYTFLDKSHSLKGVFSAGGSIYQTLLFLYDDLRPTVDQYWTWCVYVKSDAAFTGDLKMERGWFTKVPKYSPGGTPPSPFTVIETSTSSISLTGTEGWTKVFVSGQFGDADTDVSRNEAIKCSIESDSGTVWVATSMLTMSQFPINGYVENLNEANIYWTGVGPVIDTDQNGSGAFNYCGFDVDDILIEHPWIYIKEEKSIWDEVKDLGDACVARYLGMDKAGTFRMRSNITETDPTPEDTLSVARELATQIQIESANKIRVHGVRISQPTKQQIVWLASACGAFDQYKTESDNLSIPLAAGETFPDDDMYGDFFAVYGEVGE